MKSKLLLSFLFGIGLFMTTFSQNVTVSITDSICSGSTYTLGTQSLTTAGNYTELFTTMNGWDSIVNLTLVVLPSPIILSQSGNVYECGDPTVKFWVVSPGTNSYQWIYTGFGGFSDSAAIGGTSAETGYNTDTMTIHGLYTGGYYSYAVSCIITNSVGCSTVSQKDSIFSYKKTYTTDTICEGSPYLFNGTFLHTSGNYVGYFLTADLFCDSIVYLTLVVKPSSAGIDVQTACDSLTWMDGITYYADNNSAFYIVPNAIGCDSIITLNLTINHSSASTDTQIACDSLTWINGITYYTNNNTATYTTSTTEGCDSVITLNLTIETTPTIVFALTNDTICANAGAISLNALPAGGIYSGIGITNNVFDPSLAIAGQYTTITYLIGNGSCTSSAIDSAFVNFCMGLEIISTPNIKVAPNPTYDNITIISNSESAETFDIINSVGQKVHTGFINKETTIDLSTYSPGVYLIKIEKGNYFNYVKVIKQ